MEPAAKATAHRPRIGRYLITGRLGKGGMGMVYRGLDEKLDREVAIKTITTTGEVPEEAQKRFEREAKSAARMQHANIVAVYELSEDRGVRFIAMELLKGTDLDALLRSGEELLLAEKLDIAVQVCRGLAYAHDRGVFHRDIKPANIGLLEDDGTAKIMDFGIAKMEEETATQLTKTGMMVGTVNYMSPEQVHGKKVDGRTDIFSMGVILYQLLSGQRPFRGDTVTQVLYKIAKEPAPPLDLSSLGEIGPSLVSIVERALQKEPEARYQTAKELADVLQGVLDIHRRSLPTPSDPGVFDVVLAARRKVREGRVDEGLVAQLETIVAARPQMVDARRTLRTARRMTLKGAETQAPPEELITELEATFGSGSTEVQARTQLQPTVVVPEETPAPRGRGGILTALGAAVLALAAVGYFMMRGGQVGPAPPVENRISVNSLPAGAAVLVDGIDSGVVTNNDLVLPPEKTGLVELTFRKAGHRDETRTITLPLEAGVEAVTVTLESASSVTPVRSTPAGATVTLDGERLAGVTPLDVSLDPESPHTLGFSLAGHLPAEVEVAAGETPEAVEVALKALPPPGQLSVVSRYPVDVVWRGRTLASGTASPQVQLASGPQVVSLVSPSVFLRRDFQVSVPAGGRTAIEAPEVGEINIMARPDNCEVLIGGTFVDYPPIRDRPLVVGSHTVTFRWPDGVTKERTVEVGPDRPAFVQEKKE